MADSIFLLPWKLNPAQSMMRGGDKTSGFLLAWGDCHSVWSNLNCAHWLVKGDRTRRDDHNYWSDDLLTFEIWIQHIAWRGYLLAWGDCHNVWSNQNFGDRLIAAYRSRWYEHNGWSVLCHTVKTEYSPELGVGRSQNERVSISFGGFP